MALPEYYDNSKGSAFLQANEMEFNQWETDIFRRLKRCRKKGEFLSDLEKMKGTIDLYIKEQGHLYKNENEILNKK